MERFWSKVEKTDTCWLWMAGRLRHGYGMFSVNGRGRSAHRVAYELLVGPIPDGLELDHTCMVKNCVNPAHLEPVTHRENSMRAYIAYGTAARDVCPQGHVFDEANTYTTKRKARACRTCHREREKARNAANATPRIPKTECPQGHPYDDLNTYTAKDGSRNCIKCSRERTRQWRDEQRGGPPRPYGAAVVHCPAGHAYDEQNTKVRLDGRRRCRACAREYAVRRRQEAAA